MSRPLLRVDLSADAADFTAIIVESGLPLLDKWNANAKLVGDWLGRWAAEPVWEGESVAYYVRDDDGARRTDLAAVPATQADLRGPLREEVECVTDRLQKAAIQSASGGKIHQFLCRNLPDPSTDSVVSERRYQWFKYRDLDGRWRLVWCYGHAARDERAGAKPVLCANADCGHLTLLDSGSAGQCPHCGQRLTGRASGGWFWKIAAAMLLLLLAAAAGLFVMMWPRGAISGRVVRAADGLPIAGAAIRVEAGSQETTSDSKGSFRLDRLSGPQVAITVSAPGFRDQTVQADLDSGQETTVDVRLVGSAQVKGRVVYAADATSPIAGAEVVLVGYEPSKTRTDAAGQFTLDGVPPAPFQVQASAAGFRQSVIPGESPADTLCVALTGDASLSGTVVRGDTNQPVRDVQVGLSGTPFTTSTDDEGRFRLEGVRSGPAQIMANSANLSARVAKELPAGRDTTVDIVLTGGATVFGKVVNAVDSQPVAGATIAVAQTSLKTASDAEGDFTLPGIPASTVTFQVSADGYISKEIEREVSDGRQELEAVALSPAITISGVVVRAVDGQPVEDAMVAIAETRATTRTDKEGRFRFAGVPMVPIRVGVLAEGFRRSVIAVDPGAKPLRIELTGDAVLSGKVIRADTNEPAVGSRSVVQQLSSGKQEIGDIPLDASADASGSVVGDTDVRGVTLDADNRQWAVPDAKLEVRVAGQSKTLTSAADGGFVVGKVPAGVVEVRATAQGYQEAHVKKQVSPGTAWIEVPMLRSAPPKTEVAGSDGPRKPVPKPGRAGVEAGTGGDGGTRPRMDGPNYIRSGPRRARDGVLRGRLVNAVNNEPVPSARVDVNVLGDREVAYSDRRGRFEVEKIRKGLADVDISVVGFEKTHLTHKVDGVTPLFVALSPVLAPGEVRIVLTWGERPRDLDGHLYGPGPASSRFHVGYSNRQAPGVTLDVDAKEGFGPETITIKATPGTYRYYVTDPANLKTSDGRGLAQSAAQVHVYFRGNPSRKPIPVPSNPRGPVWYAFDIDVRAGRQVTVVPVDGWHTDLPQR